MREAFTEMNASIFLNTKQELKNYQYVWFKKLCMKAQKDEGEYVCPKSSGRSKSIMTNLTNYASKTYTLDTGIKDLHAAAIGTTLAVHCIAILAGLDNQTQVYIISKYKTLFNNKATDL